MSVNTTRLRLEANNVARFALWSCAKHMLAAADLIDSQETKVAELETALEAVAEAERNKTYPFTAEDFL